MGEPPSRRAERGRAGRLSHRDARERETALALRRARRKAAGAHPGRLVRGVGRCDLRHRSARLEAISPSAASAERYAAGRALLLDGRQTDVRPGPDPRADAPRACGMGCRAAELHAQHLSGEAQPRAVQALCGDRRGHALRHDGKEPPAAFRRGATVPRRGVQAEAVNALAIYVAVVQFLFGTTWTLYVIYLPQLAQGAGIGR